MKICFIVCEYNPLHNGHVYQLSHAKACTHADYVVGIMSGNATQRGELAIADKYLRGEWAIRAGMDMVVELPTEYATASAQGFACGAIKIASAFRGERALLFGTEEQDLQALARIARLLYEPPESLQSAIRAGLQRGKGYATAVATALSECPDLPDYPSSANDILAIEYLREILRRQADISPHALQRVGDGYRDTAASGQYASATALRLAHARGDRATLCKYMPSYVCDTLPSPIDTNKLGAILAYAAITHPDPTAVCGIKEGLHNRIRRICACNTDYDAIVRAITTTRYSSATVRRALLALALDQRISLPQLLETPISHINVLAIRPSARGLLSAIDLPIFTARFAQEQAIGCDVTARCDRLHALLFPADDVQMHVVTDTD